MCDAGVRSKPTGLPVDGTVTDTPLTFILTDALPRVNSSLEEVFTGIVCPALKISPGISFLPVPSTRQTYTAPVGTSWSLTLDATVRVRGARWCVALWRAGGVVAWVVVGVVLPPLPLMPRKYSATTMPTSTTPISTHGGMSGPAAGGGARARGRAG